MMPSYFPRILSGFGRRTGLGLGLLLGSAGLALAATLLPFVASYDGSAVRMEWAVPSETDVTAFELSRKSSEDIDFEPLATMPATGLLHYTFADTCLNDGRAGLLQGPVVYRLAVLGPGPDQTYTTTVAGTVSVVQRSWGTIKSMFR